MRVGALPQLDHVDRVGIRVVHADLVQEAADLPQMVTPACEVAHQLVPLAGSGAQTSCIREHHASHGSPALRQRVGCVIGRELRR